MKKKTVKIGKEKYEIKQHSYRALMTYDKLLKNPPIELEGNLAFNLLYVYSFLMGCNKEFNIDFEDFIDYMEDNPKLFEEILIFVSEKK